MSAVTFTGLASGLDTASIVEQLVELKRQPVYRLQSSKQGYQDQISALGTLKTKLLALQSAAQDLDTAREFSSFAATSSDEDRVRVSASSDAAPGSYDIIVNNLAAAQKDVSQGFDSLNDSVGEGIMSFTVNGETTDLNLTGYTSLQELAARINDAVDGVSATIINDGSETGAYRLVLSGSEAGTDHAFTVDASGISGGITPVFTNTQAALDASLTIDNIPVTVSGNSSDEIISGLTLDLVSADPGQTIHVDVATDTEGITDKVKTFVDAHNDLFSYIETQSAKTGDLYGNTTVRSIASRVQSLFTTSLSGGLGDVTMFAQIGITRGDGRTLDWDEEKFTEMLTDDFEGVRDLFVNRDGNVGKAYLIDQAIDDLTNSTDGLFKISTDALNKKIDYADQSISRYEVSIESYQKTLERKFTAMEMMVAQLQAQGGYLSSLSTNS